MLYASMAVWIGLGVDSKISIVSEDLLTVDGACDLIRKTLKEQCGVLIRDSGETESFVTFDPDFKRQPAESLEPAATATPGIIRRPRK